MPTAALQGLPPVQQATDPVAPLHATGMLASAPLTSRLTEHLASHVDALRGTLAAEQGILRPRPTLVSPAALLLRLRDAYAGAPVAIGKTIQVMAGTREPSFLADETLLTWVLGSLLANALEASAVGDQVTLGYSATGARAIFTVHNAGVMPQASRVRIFERGFSTRGAGRGFGTYGARLIAERYLEGTLRFGSNTATGTVFALDVPVRR